MQAVIRQALPGWAKGPLRRLNRRGLALRRQMLPRLTEEMLESLLAGALGIGPGNLVFVHSSVEALSPDFPFYRILSVLRKRVGPEGTLLFPTYPRLLSHEFLAGGEVFDVRRSPSFTGVLTEFARRQKGALRSLHPTKSVCAIGPLASDLTADHQDSPFPYDSCSPYYKTVEQGGAIIGIGVSTESMPLVHCADDALKNDFPVHPYHEKLFEARCIGDDGEDITVRTYAHDMSKMKLDIPRFAGQHLADDVCGDSTWYGRKFFRADAARLFEEMVRLARNGVTVYSRSVYDRRAGR